MDFRSKEVEIQYGQAAEENAHGPIPDFVTVRLSPDHSYIALNGRGEGKLKLSGALPQAPVEVVVSVYPFSEDIHSFAGSLPLQREQELRERPTNLDQSLIIAPFVSAMKKPEDDNNPVGFPVHSRTSVHVYHIIHGVDIYCARDITAESVLEFRKIADKVLSRLVEWHKAYAQWRRHSQLQVKA